MNFEQARFNMIEQQIRTWEVLDPQVLDLLFQVKREQFVPAEHRALAFADLEIPLGHGEAMMQPKVEARIVQELAVQPHESVYEVGTGSGYLTALLASRGRHVTSVEIHGDFKARAEAALRGAAIANVTLVEGDGARAPLAESAFDVIVLTGSTPEAARSGGSPNFQRDNNVRASGLFRPMPTAMRRRTPQTCKLQAVRCRLARDDVAACWATRRLIITWR